MKISANVLEWLKDIFIAVIIAAAILFFIKPTIVREHSMENTLFNNDYLFVSKQSYKLFGGTPQRGDIVVFESDLTTANGKNKLLIKRVVGLPGETIAIHDGEVYIDGKVISETYLKEDYTDSELNDYLIPEGYLFCMGDNRRNSADSRDSRIGPVSIDDIMGKAVFRLFPFDRIGGLY